MLAVERMSALRRGITGFISMERKGTLPGY
jgi:hypothetical protein